MAYTYVDTGLVTGLNDGSSFDNAWRSLKVALETVHAAGDVIWIRRRSSYTGAAHVTIPGTSDGSASVDIRAIGWPRTTYAIANSDWTQGGTTVTVNSGGMSREAHQARWVVAPNGVRYLMTRVVDPTHIVIDRPYAGASVDGAAAILAADEDYAEAQTIDDSGWTIKKADWNADPHALPYFDFGGAAFGLTNPSAAIYWLYANLDFRNSSYANGIFYMTGQTRCRGCMWKQNQNVTAVVISTTTFSAERFTIEGNGAGAVQRGISGYHARLKDGAIYNMGQYGFSIANYDCVMENLNIGVELPNGSFDISIGLNNVWARDLKLGGANGAFVANSYTADSMTSMLLVENYGKVLGDNRAFHIASAPTALMAQRQAVVAGSGDPYKRSGGADDVLLIIAGAGLARELDKADRWFEHRIWCEAGVRKFRYYCQLKDLAAGIPASGIRLRARYVSSYSSSASYQMSVLDSDETIAQRMGPDDWSQYVEVTLNVAVASLISLEFAAQWANVNGRLFVDPKVVIT